MGVTNRHEEAPRRLWRSLGHGEASRRTARRRKRGPEANEGPQKKPEETPRTFSIPFSAAKRRCMQHVGFPIVKPRFSRLGGSIWELQIDTKRLQEDSGGPWGTERQAEGQQEGEKEVQKQTRAPRRDPKRPPGATWRPPKPHNRPPRGTNRSRRDPEHPLNTIFGGEEAMYATCRFSYS